MTAGVVRKKPARTDENTRIPFSLYYYFLRSDDKRTLRRTLHNIIYITDYCTTACRSLSVVEGVKWVYFLPAAWFYKSIPRLKHRTTDEFRCPQIATMYTEENFNFFKLFILHPFRENILKTRNYSIRYGLRVYVLLFDTETR